MHKLYEILQCYLTGARTRNISMLPLCYKMLPGLCNGKAKQVQACLHVRNRLAICRVEMLRLYCQAKREDWSHLDGSENFQAIINFPSSSSTNTSGSSDNDKSPRNQAVTTPPVANLKGFALFGLSIFSKNCNLMKSVIAFLWSLVLNQSFQSVS